MRCIQQFFKFVDNCNRKNSIPEVISTKKAYKTILFVVLSLAIVKPPARSVQKFLFLRCNNLLGEKVDVRLSEVVIPRVYSVEVYEGWPQQSKKVVLFVSL